LELVNSATRSLLESLAGNPANNEMAHDLDASNPSRSPSPFPVPGWGVYATYKDTNLATSPEEQAVAAISKSLLEQFDTLSMNSDDMERSDNEDSDAREPVVAGKRGQSSCEIGDRIQFILLADDDNMEPSEGPQKRSRNLGKDDSLDPSAKWFPWRDKIVSSELFNLPSHL
jgi:hypothetical protein